MHVTGSQLPGVGTKDLQYLTILTAAAILRRYGWDQLLYLVTDL
jgi:hypothetical protein